MNKANITLVGMAGTGKTTVSKILAKNLNYSYVDCDSLITEKATHQGLDKEIVSDKTFTELEESIILDLGNTVKSIIDTGGSVIYSEKAMALLQSISTIMYLSDTTNNIFKRFEARGEPHLIGIEGKTFPALVEERAQLYRRYCDSSVDISRFSSAEEVAQEIIQVLQKN